MVVPLLIRLRKTRWESMVVQMLSALVLLVGLGLFIERII
jgi:hypothetical protein